jgi:L-2-hydroxyglutarate oxidase LhgO
MDQANILIIGGGVIGCAIAYAVSHRSRDVFLVEQNPKLGMATSTRNSGVIHSGIYYPKNSLKARLCIEGNRLMYDFCAKHNVPFRHTGKIVVAADAHEEPALSALKQNGERNGVEDLRLIGPAEIRDREPHIAGVAALLGNMSWKIYPVRGEYCEIRGPRRTLINNLVYPLPHADALSLGVHFTKTLWGTVLLGPTARYVDAKDNYERDRLTIADFVRGAKPLLPEVEESDLQLCYSGIRPKLVPPGGKGYADFVITRDPAVPQAIHLVGMESPGLTAAPAIAAHVAKMVEQMMD